MPHVAFDPSLVLKARVAARSAPERNAPAFETLLDSAPPAANNRPAPENRPSQRTADRTSARADRTNPNRDASRSDDSKSANNADKATKPSDNEALDEPAKATDAPSDAKAPEKADGESKSDPAVNAKSEAETKTDAKAADLASQVTVTPDIKTPDATLAAQTAVAAAIPAATPAEAPATLEAGTEKAAIEAAGDGTTSAGGTAKSDKSDKPAAAKTANAGATDDATDGAANAGKTASEAATKTDKVAATPEKSEKADAHARGEVQTKDSHAAKIEAADKPAFDPALAAPKGGVDPAQTAAMASRTHQATPTAAAAAAPTASVAQQAAAAIPLSGVAFEITSKALTSTNHFEIRLDPPDLGRIEVRLDVDKDGNVTSNMIVDRPETLDLLRRDAAGLDRALQDAGLKTSNNGLQFQLRDQSSNQQQDGNASNTARIVVQDETIPNTAIARDYGRLAGNSSGVDIQV